MDVSLGLAQCVAASTALLLPPAPQGARAGEPVYPLAEGRFLLRVQLAGGRRAARASTPAPRPSGEFVAPGWVDLDSPAVRLLPSARRKLQQAKENVVAGFEPPLVRRSAAVMVASGLLSFAVSALSYGLGSGDSAALPPTQQEPKLGAELRYEDPSRWQLRFLVADVGAPAPHSFRKQTNSHTNSAPGPHSNNAMNTGHSNFVAHSNIVQTGAHSNAPFVAPTLVPASHTNQVVLP